MQMADSMREYSNMVTHMKNEGEWDATLDIMKEKEVTLRDKYKGSNFVKFLNYGNSKDAVNLINITNKEFNKYGIKAF